MPPPVVRTTLMDTMVVSPTVRASSSVILASASLSRLLPASTTNASKEQSSRSSGDHMLSAASKSSWTSALRYRCTANSGELRVELGLPSDESNRDAHNQEHAQKRTTADQPVSFHLSLLL